MIPSEFEKRLNALPVETPDEIDHAMIAEAESVNDGTTVSLDAFKDDSTKKEQGFPCSHFP